MVRNLPKVPPKRGSEADQIKDPLENAFVEVLQSEEAFVRLEKNLVAMLKGGSKEIDTEQAQMLLQPFCRACWQVCERSHVYTASGDSSFYAAARAETQLVKKQLHECNLSAMRQWNEMREGTHNAPPLSRSSFGEDAITFYEPLKHLDDDMRELIYLIITDKLLQIESGVAPNSLVTAIIEAAEKGPKKSRRGTWSEKEPPAGDDKDKVAELEEEIDDLNERVEALQQQLKKSEAGLVKAEELRSKEVQRSADLEVEISQAKEALASAEARIAELSDVSGEISLLKARAGTLTEQLQQEQEANAALRAEAERNREGIERLASLEEGCLELKEAKQQLQESEADRRQLQARNAQLEREAADLRKELDALRRAPSFSPAMQSGNATDRAEVEALEAENKRLKVALEELRAKLGDLMTECKKNGVSAERMEAIADNCGLKPLMKSRSVFDDLYQDALRRVDRLEKLKEKYRLEKEKTLGMGGPHAPRTPLTSQALLDNPSRAGVLEAVQESKLCDLLPTPSPPGTVCGNSSFPNMAQPAAFVLDNTHSIFSPHPVLIPTTVSRFAAVKPTTLVMSPGERGASTLQRAQALRAQAHAEAHPLSTTSPQPPEPIAAVVPPSGSRGALTSTLAKSALVRSSAATPQSGAHAMVFGPSPRDIGTDAGNELARRLVASASLPSLGRAAPPMSVWSQGSREERAGGGATSGLGGLVAGRDAGWR